MKILPLLLLLLIGTLPAFANDTSEGSFFVDSRDLNNWCEENESMCELWISAVMEGMEFMHLIGTSAETNMFCLDNIDKDMAQIRTDFMYFISQKENVNMLDKPAVFSLVIPLNKHKCKK